MKKKILILKVISNTKQLSMFDIKDILYEAFKDTGLEIEIANVSKKQLSFDLKFKTL